MDTCEAMALFEVVTFPGLMLHSEEMIVPGERSHREKLVDREMAPPELMAL